MCFCVSVYNSKMKSKVFNVKSMIIMMTINLGELVGICYSLVKVGVFS